VVSPLVLSTTRVTAGVVSAVAGGPGVAVLAGRRQGRPAAGGGDDQRHADAERR
jgi:hypothetical protein